MNAAGKTAAGFYHGDTGKRGTAAEEQRSGGAEERNPYPNSGLGVLGDLAVEPPSTPVTLTPAAVQQVKRLIAKQGNPDLALRVGVKGGGCSGLTYVLNLEAESGPRDTVLEQDGIRILVDSRAERFVSGMEIDYSLSNFIDGGFKFRNPNAARSCGCGTSFTPKG